MFGGIGVLATTSYLASQIEYTNKNTNTTVTLDSVLDELYIKSNIEEYIVGDTITPDSSSHTFYTDGKKVKGNIVVNAIPSEYKDVRDSTIDSASDILVGKTAYLKNGTKVTGTRDKCEYKNITLNSSAMTSDGQNLFGFNPTRMYCFATSDTKKYVMITYNNVLYLYDNGSNESSNSNSRYSVYTESNFFARRIDGYYIYNANSAFVGRTYDCLACV